MQFLYRIPRHTMGLPYMPTLGWFEGSMGRQSYGSPKQVVSGSLVLQVRDVTNALNIYQHPPTGHHLRLLSLHFSHQRRAVKSGAGSEPSNSVTRVRTSLRADPRHSPSRPTPQVPQCACADGLARLRRGAHGRRHGRKYSREV